MSNRIDDGGQAFPSKYADCGHGAGYGADGMSLRDWFAEQEVVSSDDLSALELEALHGGKFPDFQSDPMGHIRAEAKALARLRYIRADAMLEARKELSLPKAED